MALPKSSHPDGAMARPSFSAPSPRGRRRSGAPWPGSSPLRRAARRRRARRCSWSRRARPGVRSWSRRSGRSPPAGLTDRRRSHPTPPRARPVRRRAAPEAPPRRRPGRAGTGPACPRSGPSPPGRRARRARRESRRRALPAAERRPRITNPIGRCHTRPALPSPTWPTPRPRPLGFPSCGCH